jgi:hypothetical protein
MVTLRPDTVIRFGLARVGARLSAEADVHQLSAFLADIESNDTPLAVREIAVTQPDPVAPEARPEALRAEIFIQTIARIQPQPKVRADVPRRTEHR